jgi:hypothetical protein
MYRPSKIFLLFKHLGAKALPRVYLDSNFCLKKAT